MKKGSNPPPPSVQKIELGDKVKDKITGFEGIVVESDQWLHGCTRHGVKSQNLGDNGLPLNTCFFDEPQLKLITKEAVKALPMTKVIFEFGDKVKDTLTDHQGIISARAVYFNGCIRVGVQGQFLDKDGQPNNPCWFDQQQLEIIAAGVVASDKTKQEERPGGPRPASKRNPGPPER